MLSFIYPWVNEKQQTFSEISKWQSIYAFVIHLFAIFKSNELKCLDIWSVDYINRFVWFEKLQIVSFHSLERKRGVLSSYLDFYDIYVTENVLLFQVFNEDRIHKPVPSRQSNLLQIKAKLELIRDQILIEMSRPPNLVSIIVWFWLHSLVK